MSIEIKRVYEPPSKDDGLRILVDRLWPRGMSKASLQLDEWLKDLAPSNELRKRFRHHEGKWEEFQKLYFKELDLHPELVEQLIKKSRAGKVTLLFAAKDTEHNNAVALKNYLERKAR
ncbi:MAG TPA: DUF488 domain-containing protein [Anaerolineales bacterium]|nr:DUF488 domain-containing protein [Anaerolineales bacterium]